MKAPKKKNRPMTAQIKKKKKIDGEEEDQDDGEPFGSTIQEKKS